MGIEFIDLQTIFRDNSVFGIAVYFLNTDFCQ